MKRRGNKVIFSMLVVMISIYAFLIVNILSASLFNVHLRSKEDISAYSNNSDVKSVIKSRRGTIYESTQTVVAEDVTSYNLMAYLDESRVDGKGNPHYVVDTEATAIFLAEILEGDVDRIKKLLDPTSGKYQTEFGTIGKGLSLNVKTKIEESDLPGLEFTKTSRRHYPLGQFSSQLIGFSMLDQEIGHQIGKMGIERLYNDELTGTDGESVHTLTVNGYKLPNTESTVVDAKDGNDIYLTLNKNIQLQLEDSLLRSMEMANTDKAWGMVMDIKTGKIIAIAQAPSFDPEERENVEYLFYPSDFEYEPGSTMKAITYAAAIEEGLNLDETFNSNTIYFNFDAKGVPFRVSQAESKYAPISNANGKSHGNLTYAQGFEVSSNVGMVEMARQKLPAATFEKYLDKFNFFKPTTIDAINGSSGRKLFNYPIEKVNNTFGQGSTVTMMQMASAFQAILNDGIMMQPYVIDQIVDKNEVVYKSSPEEIGRPISKGTSEVMRGLMANVIEGDLGTGKNYKLDEIDVIAKTGTAQVVIDGKYSRSRYISSVGSAFPKEDPQYLVFYAYESEYAPSLYFQQAAPINDLVLKVSNEFNLIKNSTPIDDNEDQDDIIVSDMPSLINHSLDYAKDKLANSKANINIIGDGNNIINQYPNAGDKIISNQKIILYTGKGKITMPDMTGWSRKEVVAFWEASGSIFIIEGNGAVYNQSVPKGTIIDETIEVRVKLR